MPEPASHTDSPPAAAEPPHAGAPAAAVPHIPLLRWPAQDHRRYLLAARGEPRLLIVAAGATPPALLDDLELWIPDGAEPDVVLASVSALQRKAQEQHSLPVLDDDGLLWFRGRWVAISDTQIPVVDLLVRNYQRLVHNHDIEAVYHRVSDGRSPASLRTLIRRIGQRLTKLGLKLHVVRTRGIILATPETPPEPPETPGSVGR